MRRLASLLLLCAVPAPAFAFFCTRADTEASSPTQVWMSRCIPYYVSHSGVNFDSEERIRLIAQSFAVWSSPACTDITFRDRGRTLQDDAFDVDHPEVNQNVIASIEGASDSFPDSRLLAITLTRFSVLTGEILDADILLNADKFRFDDVSDPVACLALSGPTFDLRNTLIHEMGHFIGFDHTPIREATMFASADRCEVGKRDLAEDDLMGLCSVYPKDGPTATCTPPATYTPASGLDPLPFRNQCDRPTLPVADPGGCGCGVNRESNGLFVLGLIALLARKRSRFSGI